MRDSMKMTVPYQFGQVLLAHIGAAAVSFVFQMVAFWYFIGRNGFKEVMAVIFMLIYAGMIYNSVRRLSLLDHKSYTPLKPSIVKGVMFGVCIAITNVVLLILWKIIWSTCADSTGLNGVGIAVNAVFTFMTFPYYGVMGASKGAVTVISIILMILVPTAASTAGYIAGKYKFDILDKIERFAYEKEEE